MVENWIDEVNHSLRENVNLEWILVLYIQTHRDKIKLKLHGGFEVEYETDGSFHFNQNANKIIMLKDKLATGFFRYYEANRTKKFLYDLHSLQYRNLIVNLSKLEFELRQLPFTDERYGVLFEQSARLKTWENEYRAWLLNNDYELPAITKTLHKAEVDNLRDENIQLNRQLSIANTKLKKFRMKARLGKEDLAKLIDKTRKKNGTHNYAALGRELGIDNQTAERLVISQGLKNY
jgi:hypothetical protein